ncbi:hypothetical protein AGMMS49928_15330 [Spirochaetia bacterium]|nr:hypothetical protein AGMMS49928_15330 [Spirochaetia bacterium]
MCPDRQILSLYHDDELPSPWKEKLESHLASCPACVARLDQYRDLSRVLLENDTAETGEFLEKAKVRVREKLASPAGAGIRSFKLERRKVWSRRISLPLPAAAAFAAVLALALFAAFRSPAPTPVPSPAFMAGGMGLQDQGIAAAADMSGILQYLGDNDSGDIMVIRLPESKHFKSSGEPAIIKAADYSSRGSLP